MFKKIDLLFNGDYVCSTNQSRTCREAVKKYLASCEWMKHTPSGLTLTRSQILKNPRLLKARFDKEAQHAS